MVSSCRVAVIENIVASREKTEVESAALRWVRQFFVDESQPKIHIYVVVC